MKKNKKKLSIQKVKVVELKRNQAVGGFIAREGEEIEGREPYTMYCPPADDGGDDPVVSAACNPVSLGTIRNCAWGTSGCLI